MTKIYFFELEFKQHDENSPTRGELNRILAGNSVFYAYTRQIVNQSLFSLLKPGDTVYIGAHLLNDGTYWLHWLYAPNKGVSHTKEQVINRQGIWLKLITSILALLTMACAILTQFDTFTLGLSMILFCIVGAYFYTPYVRKLRVSYNNHLFYLKQGLTKVMQGDFSFFTTDDSPSFNQEIMAEQHKSSEIINDIDHLHIDEIDRLVGTNLITQRGLAKRICVTRRFITTQKSKIPYVNFAFSCYTSSFSLDVQANTFPEQINPIFYKHHPLFLGENDPVTLIINNENNKIIGLCNKKDYSVYLKKQASVMSYTVTKNTYVGLFFIWLFSLVMTVILTMADWWKYGLILDKWNKADLIGIFYPFGPLFFAMFAGLLLCMEIMSLITRRSSLNAVRVVFARHMLMSFRVIHKKSIVIQEIA